MHESISSQHYDDSHVLLVNPKTDQVTIHSEALRRKMTSEYFIPWLSDAELSF